MHIKNRRQLITYLSFFVFFSLLLIREYIYVHPYNTGYGLLGPGWKYTSTRTFTWWFVLIGSIVLITPIIRMQKIGLLGFFLLIGVIVRPLIQYKFPEEQVIDFYSNRAEVLNQIIKRYDNERNRTIKNSELKDLDFDQMNIYKGTYYFYLYDPDWAGQGLCYDEDGKLPKENFGRYMKYKKLNQYWYEFKSY